MKSAQTIKHVFLAAALLFAGLVHASHFHFDDHDEDGKYHHCEICFQKSQFSHVSVNSYPYFAIVIAHDVYLLKTECAYISNSKTPYAIRAPPYQLSI